MLGYLSKAVSQLSDPALRRVLWLGLAGALTVFVLLWGGTWWLLGQIDPESLPLLPWIRDNLGGVADLLGGLLFLLAMGFATFFLFPAVVTIVVGLFLEDVAKAVERRHYPSLPPAREQSLAEVLGTTTRFAALAIALNLLALPFYLLLSFLPPANLILFYVLNGYLTSREYFELIAFRRLMPAEAAALRQRNRSRLMLAGILLVFLLTVPIVNLVVPVIATAFMVHVYQSLAPPSNAAPGSAQGGRGRGGRRTVKPV